MPGRKYIISSTSTYRYSINGQEKEFELNENITSAGYWEYDSRIGRRWNVDPVVKEFESPFLCFSGNPIFFSDPNGMDAGNTGRKEKSTSEKPTEIRELVIKCKAKRKEKMSWDDIPTDRFQMPGLGGAMWGEFVYDTHKTAAQAFAATRQDQPNVAGVAMFDLDDNTTIVTTHVKIQTWNGNDWEKTVWTTYSIFREDRVQGAWMTGVDGRLIDIKEEDFFSMSNESIYSKEIVQAPIGLGSPARSIERNAGRIIQAGLKVGKFTLLQFPHQHFQCCVQ